MQKQQQNTKCHFFVTDIPFKAQVNTFCSQLNLLMGLLFHKEACPTCLTGKCDPTGYQGPEEDACNTDTHSTETRGSGPLGFSKVIEISETLEGNPGKRADTPHGSYWRRREMSISSGVQESEASPQNDGFKSGLGLPLRKRFMVSLLASFMAVCPE